MRQGNELNTWDTEEPLLGQVNKGLDDVGKLIAVSGNKAIGIIPVKLHKCPGCGRWMADGIYDSHTEAYWERPGTRARRGLIHDTCIRAGWVIQEEGEARCVECVKAQQGRFVCLVCKETRSFSELGREVYGGCTEHICKPCWDSLSAKEWSEIMRAAEEGYVWERNQKLVKEEQIEC